MAYAQNIILQTGNGANYLTWNFIVGVTLYTVQRSTDQVTWVTIGTPSVNAFLDSAVSIGTNYFYQVGVGATPPAFLPSTPASITPCAPGQINLGYLRYESRLRSDMLRSNFLTNDEWNIMINQSADELYGMLVTKFGEDYFLAPPQVFQSSGQLTYPLPDGTNFLNTNGTPDPNGTPAPACFKVYGMDYNSFGAQISNATGWVSMSRFNIADRNKYNLMLGAASMNVAGQYVQAQFREMGTDVWILPVNNGQYFRLLYVPLNLKLLLDTDMMPFSYSGWHEYVVVDVASKALAKQQKFDQATELLNRKAVLMERIETEAANRSVGQPNTSTNSRANLGDPNFGGGIYGNGQGGWGSGGGYGY